jgi:hypothetical protein
MSYLDRVFENTVETVTIPNPMIFTGAVKFSGAFSPVASDGAALGTVALPWSDLFLASGGVINFANGNALLTHSTGLLTFSAGNVGFGVDATGIDVTFYGETTAYKTWWDQNGDTNGAWYFGADTKGVLVTAYGATTGCGVFWDPDGDTNGTLSIGASGGSKGNDLLAYGTTNGNYMQWDQSANSLLLVGTSTVLNVAGTTASSSTATGAAIIAGGVGIGGNAWIGGTLNLADDMVLTLGTTKTTPETKITLEFDETTTGIGQLLMGDLSTPMVLNTNPGASVAAHVVNINHSAGAGDCDDLLASYTKINVIGSGDSGLTIVGQASRAYVGLTGGANNSVASQAYGTQAWARHQGTGAITAMSGLSAKMDVGADNFTASTINAGHFHVDGAATVAGQFDGVMIEVYPDVTCLDSALAIAVDGAAVVDAAIRLSGATANDFLNFAATGTCGITTSDPTVGAANSWIKCHVGDTITWLIGYADS